MRARPESCACTEAGLGGLWRSLTGSLAAVLREPPELDPGARRRLDDHGTALADSLEREPKSARWCWRARVGERVRWYELPERP